MANNSRVNITLGFNADTDQAKRQINDLVNQLRSIQSTPTTLVDDTSLRKASAAAAELQGHLQKAVDVNTGKLDLSRFSASLKQSGKQLSDYRRDLEAIGPVGSQAFLSVAKSIATAETPLLRTNKRLNEFMTTMKNTAKWQISSSIMHGFMGAVQQAYGYSQSLNESLNNIRIVTGYNTEQMAEFASQANKAAKALSTTTTDYTNASLIYFQQGLSDEEVQKRTDITVKMANVARDSVDNVSNQLTAIWNNFYEEGGKSLEYYADVMTALGAKTASSTEEIAGGLEKFAAIGDTIGLSYEYAASALATITSNTRQSEEVVGTALKTIFARIQGLNLGETLEDGTSLNKYSEALAKVGVSIFEQNGELKAMDNILDELAARWDMLNSAQQTSLAQTVAGVRQYTQLIALMENWNNGDEDSFMANINTSRNAEGALNQQANIYADSWEAARDRVKAAQEDVYDSLINDEFFIQLDDILTPILSGVADIVDSFGGLGGIIGFVGSLFLRYFSKQIPGALKELKQNLMVVTGQANKIAIAEQQKNIQNISAAQSMTKEKSAAWTDLEVTKKINEMQIKLNANAKQLSDEEREVYELKIQQVQAIGDILVAQAKEIDNLEKITEEQDNAAKHVVRRSGVEANRKQNNDLNTEQASKISEINSIQQKVNAAQLAVKQLTKTQEELNNKPNSWKQITKNAHEIENVTSELTDQKKILDDLLQQLKKAQQELVDIDVKITDKIDFREDYQQDYNKIIAQADAIGKVQGAMQLAENQAKAWQSAMPTSEEDIAKVRATAKALKDSLVGKDKAFSDDNEFWNALAGGKQINFDTDSIEDIIKLFTQVSQKAADADAHIQKMEDTLAEDIDKLQEKVPDTENSIRKAADAHIKHSQAVTVNTNAHKNFNDANIELNKHLNSISEIMGKTVAGMMSGASAANTINNAFRTWGDETTTLGEKLMDVVTIATSLSTSIVPAVTSIKSIATETKKVGGTWKDTMQNILKSGDVWLAAAQLVVVGISLVVDSFERAKEESKELAKQASKDTAEMREANEVIREQVKAYDELLKRYKTGEDVQEDLNKTLEDLIKKYGDEVSSLAILTGNYEDYYEVLSKIHRLEQERAAKDEYKSYQTEYRTNASALNSISAEGDLLQKIGGNFSLQSAMIKSYNPNDNLQDEAAIKKLEEIFTQYGLAYETTGINYDSATKKYNGKLFSFSNIKATDDNAVLLFQAFNDFLGSDEFEGLNEIGKTAIKDYIKNVQDYGLAALTAKDLAEETQLRGGQVEGFDNNGFQKVSTFTDYAQIRGEGYQVLLNRNDGDKDQADLDFATYISNSTNSSLVKFESQYKQLNAAADTMGISMDEMLKWFNNLSNTYQQLFFTSGLDITGVTTTNDLMDQLGAAVAGNNQAKAQSQAELAKQIADWASSDNVEDLRNIFENTTFDWESFKDSLGDAWKDISVDELKSQIASGTLGNINNLIANYISQLNEEQKNAYETEKKRLEIAKGTAENELNIAQEVYDDVKAGRNTDITLEEAKKNLDEYQRKYNEAVQRLDGLEANTILNIRLNEQNIEELNGEVEDAINPVDIVPQLIDTSGLENEIQLYEAKIAEYEEKVVNGGQLTEEEIKLHNLYRNKLYGNAEQGIKGLYAALEEAQKTNLENASAQLVAFANGAKDEADNYISTVFSGLTEEQKTALVSLNVKLDIDENNIVSGINNYAQEIQKKIDEMEEKIYNNDFGDQTYEELQEGIDMWTSLLTIFNAFVANYNTAAGAAADSLWTQGNDAVKALEHTDAKASYDALAQVDNTISYLQNRIKELQEDGSEVALSQLEGLYKELNTALGKKQEIINAQKAQIKNDLINGAQSSGLSQLINAAIFDKDGNIMNEAAIVDSIQAEINNKEEEYKTLKTDADRDKKKEEIEALKALIILINNYNQSLGESRNILSDINEEKKYKGDDHSLKNSVRELDIYRDIDEVLSDIEDSLSDIGREKSKSYGQGYLNAIKKENELLDEQKKALQTKIELAKQQLVVDKADLAYTLKKAGVTAQAQYDENDYLINYAEITKQTQDQLIAYQEQYVAAQASNNVELMKKLDALIQKQKEYLSLIMQAADQTLNTKSIIVEAYNGIDEAIDQQMANISEGWNYSLELDIKINDNELSVLDTMLARLDDDLKGVVESFAIMSQKMVQTTAVNFEKKFSDLEAIKGQISPEQYTSNLQTLFDEIGSNINSLIDMDKEMREYYGKALDAAGETFDYYSGQLEHLTGLLEHYQNIVTLVEGEVAYDKIGTALEGKVSTLQNEMDAASSYYEMLKAQQEEVRRQYEMAPNGSKAKEVLEENLRAITEATNEAQEEMLSKTEEWAEATKELMENTMAKAARAMEMAFTDGLTFDSLSSSMDRLSSYQDEYLTKTNQMYETEKLMRTAQQAVDKTQNKIAKDKLQEYIKETSQLQNKNKLSKLELEIQQAKYDLLVAEIALEEAQNAKSTVRLRRDSEGNFGYVYTADSDKIASAEQDLADAQNNLYNIGLEAANDYGQKRIELQQQLADDLMALEERRVNGEFETEQAYYTARDSLIKEYTDLFTAYADQYTIAMGTDANIQQEAWVTSYQNIIDKTNVWSNESTNAFDQVGTGIENWKTIVEQYMGDCETAYSDWKTTVDTKSKEVNELLTNTKGKVDEVTKASTGLKDEVDTVVKDIGTDLTLMHSYVVGWATNVGSQVDTIIGKYQALQTEIQKAMLLAQQQSATGGITGGLTGGNHNPNNTDTKPNEGIVTNPGIPDPEAEKKAVAAQLASRAEGLIRAVHYGVIGYGDKSGWHNDAIAHGYNAEEIALAQKAFNDSKPGAGYDYFFNEALKLVSAFDTGGYTGAWGPEGRLAMVHEKEIILNEQDTKNFLAATGILKDIVSVIDLQSMYNQMQSPAAVGVSSGGGFFEQSVHIEANFPGVTDRNEIQEAFNNLLNTAQQYVNRK